MIEFMSSWAKGLGLAIVIVSILEMLLPNNKTKKYIRMVMGVYVLFTIISPFIQNKDVFDVNKIDLENITSQETSSSVNQTSMDERIEELYMQELEKDITEKIEEKGYKVNKCKVDATIGTDEEETKIDKIELKVQKANAENTIVTQIQKIKPIDTSTENQDQTKLDKQDIQNIKEFLIEEYGVSEKCLKIN